MAEEERVFFEVFYREHFEELVVYAYRFLKNWDDAKVATQEAFLTGLRRIDKFYSSESPMGWIKETIWKTAGNMNHVRKNRAGVVVPLETLINMPFAYDHYDNVDSVVAHCAEILTPGEYALFKRTMIDGVPYAEAAKEFGIISEGACRKRIQRLLKKLKKNWDRNT